MSLVAHGLIRVPLNWAADMAWAMCPSPDEVWNLAQRLAQKDGHDPDDEATVEAYVEAIRSKLINAVDEILFELRRTACDGLETEVASWVRLSAAKRLTDSRAAEPAGVTS